MLDCFVREHMNNAESDLEYMLNKRIGRTKDLGAWAAIFRGVQEYVKELGMAHRLS